MSKLDDLENLADGIIRAEAIRQKGKSILRPSQFDAQTIKQMVALIRRMGNAMSHIDPRINYAYDIDTEREYLDAVAAFKAFERGEP